MPPRKRRHDARSAEGVTVKNGRQASAFALPMFDPMEEAMLLAFHIGYEQDAQRAPVLDTVGTVRELETELFECLMVAA